MKKKKKLLVNDLHAPRFIIKDGRFHLFQEIEKDGKKEIVHTEGDATEPLRQLDLLKILLKD